MKLKIIVVLTVCLLIGIIPSISAQAPAKIYWTEYYGYSTLGVWRANLNGQSPEELCTAYYGFEGVAIDFQNNKMYLAAPHQNKIERADLDGSNREDFVTSIYPVDITLDLSAGKIYWTDYTYSNAVIKRANLDGSGVESITAHLGDGCDLQGMTIDVPGGKIYWVERGDDVIVKANLDGTSIQTILHCWDGVSNSWDVAVYGSKLYWTDALLGTDNISKADLDGGNVVNDVIPGLNKPRCMAIDHTTGKLYWVSSGDNCIKRADVDGSNLETLVTGLSHPYGIALDYNINSLPVELSSFTVQLIGSSPVLCWTTQSETNNSGWNVYRSESNNTEEMVLINFNLIPGSGTTSIPTDYSFEDEYEVVPNNTYWYWIESVDYSGETCLYGAISLLIPEEGTTPELPQLTILKNNYPNPFNPDTTIYFSVKESETAQLSIFNAKGQIIEIKTFEAGIHNYFWDASSFSSGIYLYQLETESFSEVRKMLLVK